MNRNDMRKIAFICDDNYVMPTAVAITSLVYNVKDGDKYTVYILCDNVSQDKKIKLSSLNSDNVKVITLDVDNTKLKNAKMPSNTHISKSTYVKILIPEILKDESRVLYLDSDIIIKSDISDIFNIDISDYCGAVVSDLAYTHEKGYYNAGVIYMNLEEIRKEGIMGRMIAFANNNVNVVGDQKGFNLLMKNVKYMSVLNNFVLHLLYGHCGINEICEFYGLSGYKNLNEIIKDVRILHFSSSCKPWKHYDCICKELWMKYYKLSPFKNNNLELSCYSSGIRQEIENEFYNSKSYKIGNFFVKLYHFIRRK